MTAENVREALIQLEEAMGIGHPIGGAELPDEIRFFRVLHSLRDILCPRLGQLVEAAETKVGDLVAITADCIVSAVGKVPLPAATVAKHIVGIGFDRFCENPAALLGGDDAAVGQNKATGKGDVQPDDNSVSG